MVTVKEFVSDGEPIMQSIIILLFGKVNNGMYIKNFKEKVTLNRVKTVNTNGYEDNTQVLPIFYYDIDLCEYKHPIITIGGDGTIDSFTMDTAVCTWNDDLKCYTNRR